MAFEGLSDKLQATFHKLKSNGIIREKDLDMAMREIRLALLEADVNFKVVKDFIASVKTKAIGEGVYDSLTPAQMVIKIVRDEMTRLLGGENSKLTFDSSGFSVYMLVGLQGAGKTTTAAKLASYLKASGKKPMLVACDVYRPAAIDQLEIVGKQVSVPVYSDRESKDVTKIADAAIKLARKQGNNIVLIDTAGRLQIDDDLMQELRELKSKVNPSEILLISDALSGQDAVNVASGFDETLGLSGIIMTKMDGDSRGGAALSVKAVTGKPIKFIGSGEKLNALEAFHPDRVASRILGMGDVLSLIEEAESKFEESEARRLEESLRTNKFDLNDFLDQMRQINKMGGLGKLLDMMPGIKPQDRRNLDLVRSTKELSQMESIILSMTAEERKKPTLLNASRRKRIAAGSGNTVTAVNSMMKRYEETRQMMKKLNSGNMNSKLLRGFKLQG